MYMLDQEIMMLCMHHVLLDVFTVELAAAICTYNMTCFATVACPVSMRPTKT